MSLKMEYNNNRVFLSGLLTVLAVVSLAGIVAASWFQVAPLMFLCIAATIGSGLMASSAWDGRDRD